MLCAKLYAKLYHFQLLAANALTPVQTKSETKYKVNTAALTEDFRILGDGLVKEIKVL